jgi:hypothetical protein
MDEAATRRASADEPLVAALNAEQKLPVQPVRHIRTASEGSQYDPRRVLWRSCCVEMDSRALLFFSQLVISLLVLLFCVQQIASLADSEWAKMTATFIIGVWLPSPRANK